MAMRVPSYPRRRRGARLAAVTAIGQVAEKTDPEAIKLSQASLFDQCYRLTDSRLNPHRVGKSEDELREFAPVAWLAKGVWERRCAYHCVVGGPAHR